jgi:subtilisin family serine protease
MGTRPRMAGLLAGFLVLLGACGPASRPAARPSGGPDASVIVRAVPGQERAVEAAVASLGGEVTRHLGIINGFSATLPGAALGVLRAFPATISVTPNQVLHAQGLSATAATAYDPLSDVNSMYNIDRITGATTYWKNGYTGQGVGVAVIDSGVAPVDGLGAPGKVMNGPDLSFESQASNLQYLDSFGHGTHISGIIAGRSNAATPGSYLTDTTSFLGMAPDATIVSMKVADAHGATDVSQVLAAIDWVVQHKDDSGMNIRVLNLSYGTAVTQKYTLDPLAYAAEQAWKAGIVMVASVGNSGYQRGSGAPGLADPAYDPFVIAAGASDSHGTLKIDDDDVASFSASSAGCGSCKKPDFVAPGAHVVSLRDPGSQIDSEHGNTGVVTDTLFRGSGTSQSAAVISGAAALIISRTPSITPDQVKKLLASTARKLGGFDSEAQGAGEIRLANAYTEKIDPHWTQKFTPSTGDGSLEGSRGLAHLMMDGVTLTGEQDIFGTTFDASAMATLEANAKAWSTGEWNAKAWSGDDWTAKAWSGNCWSTTTWVAKAWSGADWVAKAWSNRTWQTSGWSTGDWATNSWLAGDWAGAVWANSSWS